MKLWILIVLLAFSSSAFAVTKLSQADAESTGFPIVISESGSYKLTSNLDMTAPGLTQSISDLRLVPAIQITADHVELNLGGHAIAGVGDPSIGGGPSNNGQGAGVRVEADSATGNLHTYVTIRNGSVLFSSNDGVVLGDHSKALDLRIECSYGHGIVVGDVGMVANNVIEGPNAFGILLLGAGTIVRSNTVADATNHGIGTSDAGQAALVVQNTVKDSGSGITVDSESLVGPLNIEIDSGTSSTHCPRP